MVPRQSSEGAPKKIMAYGIEDLKDSVPISLVGLVGTSRFGCRTGVDQFNVSRMIKQAIIPHISLVI
jgi:hypothetical protein